MGTTSWRRRAARLAAVVGASALGVGAFATTAGADPSSSGTVAQGNNPANLPSAIPEGSTPASTPVDVSFSLRARNLPQLEAEVTAGWTGAYLTTSQFAAEYGQTPQ